MSFTASAVLQVQTNGNDSTGGGVFDPGVSGMFTTLGITLATSAAPVVASSGEVASDVNAWFYLKSGTSSIPGWYQITAVDTSAHTYTLNAAIGAAVLANGTINTAVGCGTSATLTNQTGSVDFSQQTTNAATGTASVSGTTLTATTSIFTKQMVGNGVTNGTNWRVITAFTSATAVTIDSTVSWTSQSITVGGALASPAIAASLTVTSNTVWMKGGTYSIGTGTVNTSGNRVNAGANNPNTVIWSGYTSIRGDGGNATLQASGAVTTAIFTTSSNIQAHTIMHLIFDGNNQTSVNGIAYSTSTSSTIYRCQAINCPGIGITTAAQAGATLCYASNCGTGFQGPTQFCVAQACTTGFSAAANIGSQSFSIADRCTTGFTASSNQSVQWLNNVAYTGTTGFVIPSGHGGTIQNCISFGNSGKGYSGTPPTPYLLFSCYSGSNGTANDPTIGITTLSTNPFIDPDNATATSRNFGLTAAAIGIIGRVASPGAFLGLALTVSFPAAGAVQPPAFTFNPLNSPVIQPLMTPIS